MGLHTYAHQNVYTHVNICVYTTPACTPLHACTHTHIHHTPVVKKSPAFMSWDGEKFSVDCER